MLITSYAEMKAHIDNGGHLSLNRRGELQTQSRFMHFFQRIGDAFRSLSSAGLTHIKIRNANLRAAMEDMERQDTIINQVRTEIPRPAVLPPMPTLFAENKISPLEGLKKQLQAIAHDAINRMCPHQDTDTRAVLYEKVMESLRDLPELAMQVGGDTRFLHENVEECIKTLLSNSPNQPSFEQNSDLSQNASSPMDNVRSTAIHILSQELPQLNANSRNALAAKIVNQFQSVSDVIPQLSKEDLHTMVRDSIKEHIASLSVTASPTQASVFPLRTLQRAEDINANSILTQGHNTCFMASVINSMMTTEKGRKLLKENILPGGKLWAEVQKDPSKTPWISHPSFSKLECLLASAYKPHDPFWKEGDIGIAIEVAKLFGMTSACYNMSQRPTTREEMAMAEYQIQLPRPNAVETIRQRLEEGKMVLIRHNLHYRAVVGTDGEQLILRNSLGGNIERVPINLLDEAEIDVLEYPEDK